MGVLRDRMVREMLLREFSASTQKLYLATLTDLARYHHQSPDTLDATQVQDFLLYLTQERHLASSSVSVAAFAIRFFYTQTLKRLDLAILHPWSQQLRVHVDLHGVVPGGALDVDGDRWVSARPTFLFPVRALSRVFCHRFLTRIETASQQQRVVVPASLAAVGVPAAFRAWLTALRRQALGPLCEAAVWRARDRPRRPRALHPPRGHFQPSDHGGRRRPGVVHLSKPPAWWRHPNTHAARRVVHRPLLAPRRAATRHAHPARRLPRQRGPPGRVDGMPVVGLPVAGCREHLTARHSRQHDGSVGTGSQPSAAGHRRSGDGSGPHSRRRWLQPACWHLT